MQPPPQQLIAPRYTLFRYGIIENAGQVSKPSYPAWHSLLNETGLNEDAQTIICDGDHVWCIFGKGTSAAPAPGGNRVIVKQVDVVTRKVKSANSFAGTYQAQVGFGNSFDNVTCAVGDFGLDLILPGTSLKVRISQTGTVTRTPSTQSGVPSPPSGGSLLITASPRYNRHGYEMRGYFTQSGGTFGWQARLQPMNAIGNIASSTTVWTTSTVPIVPGQGPMTVLRVGADPATPGVGYWCGVYTPDAQNFYYKAQTPWGNYEFSHDFGFPFVSPNFNARDFIQLTEIHHDGILGMYPVAPDTWHLSYKDAKYNWTYGIPPAMVEGFGEFQPYGAGVPDFPFELVDSDEGAIWFLRAGTGFSYDADGMLFRLFPHIFPPGTEFPPGAAIRLHKSGQKANIVENPPFHIRQGNNVPTALQERYWARIFKKTDCFASGTPHNFPPGDYPFDQGAPRR